MTTKELREKDTDVLTQELNAQTKHLFDLRSQAVTEKLEDPTQIGKTRRGIARIKTLLHQRTLSTTKTESVKAEPAKTEAKAAPKKAAKAKSTKKASAKVAAQK